MPVQGGKRRERRPVWYGENNTSQIQNYSVGNWLTFTGNPDTTAIAIGNTITLSSSFGNTAIGQQIDVTGFYGAICLGQQLSVGCSSGICIGHNSTIGPFGGGTIVLGDQLYVQGGGGGMICAGFNSTIYTPGGNHISIGNTNQILAGGGSGSVICLGNGLTSGGDSGGNVLLGVSLSTQGQGSNLVLVGTYSRTYINCSESLCLGNGLNIFDHTGRAICVGYQSTLGPETGDCIVIGSGSTIYNLSVGSTVIGHQVAIGAATNATFFMIVPDLAGLANNDWVSLPDGRGGTIEIEFQVDGSFVPFGPPRLVADVQWAANSTDVGHTLVSVWNSVYQLPVTFPIQSESVGGDGRWTGNFIYPSPGAAGNGWSVVPTVVSGLFTGSTSSGGTQASSPTCLAMGNDATIHGNHSRDILIGFEANLGILGDVVAYGSNIAIGDQVFIGNARGVTNSIAMGKLTAVTNSDSVGMLAEFVNSPNALAILVGSKIGLNSSGAIALGDHAEISNDSAGSITIGWLSSVTTVSAAGIAIGPKATAADHECIVGYADGVTNLGYAMNTFAVRGIDPINNVLDTIKAVVAPPVDHDSGLTFVYNNGGTFVNRIIRVSTTSTVPGAGLALYIDP